MLEIPALAAARREVVIPRLVEPLSTAEPLLKADNLEISYEFVRRTLFSKRVGKPVVRNVSFDIKPSETFALVGESGSGKSTIARTVAGLHSPSGGTLTFEDRSIAAIVDSRPPDLRRDLQLVLQNPDASLNPRQRVREIIGRPVQFFFNYSKSQVQQRVDQLLEDIRLDSSYANRYPDELSGGERQRVAIARALAANPKLLLCDEVLSALDVSVQADILDLLRSLQSEHRIAYLFISHDLAVVRSIAHRVGVLYRGELVEVGAVAEVYAPPHHPYTHMLLSAVPEIGVEHEHSSAIRIDATPSSGKKFTACPFADRCPWKLGPICEEQVPPWRATSETHGLRCHIPLPELTALEMETSRVNEVAEAGQPV
jgi:peptide/nickel transport system ATP-binding protein